MMALHLMGIALTALLSENFVLVNCLGIGTRVQSFDRPLDAWRTGASLTIVMVFTTLLSWIINLILQHFSMVYFQTLVFALVAVGTVAGLRYFLRICIPELSRRLDPNLASITSNCAAMGSALLTTQRGYGLGPALLFSLFGGLGAAIALISFAGLHNSVSMTSCPACFRGIPIKLITVGLMGLALLGYCGLHLV